ncbi:MAG: UDP-glucose/GDP-mannose dehydrogenase family protein, partial [Deltaproteobacteria bacterium]|nr:UDP-glucose/GDP-mannose dehydrogenase family protein [Deltaproteobacteria bacterium]
MKITIIGTGYVGLVTGACLADTGNEVWCVDKNEIKIENLKKGIIPIYEPGLEPVVTRGVKENRLYFTTDLPSSLNESDVCFLTVDTPPNADGKADLTNVLAVARSLGEHLKKPMLVVTKSTVPVGTTLIVQETIQSGLKKRGLDPQFAVCASNPEFLKEGTAVQDFKYPDRVVVGVSSPAHAEVLKELYEPFMRKRECFLVMDIPSSELSKYAANAMLATRISFMNEIAALCEAVGADISEVRQSIGWDPRIGSQFLYAGLGYGGSCLPKDVLALLQLGREKKCAMPLIEATDLTNQRQRERFLNRIVGHFDGE